MKQARCWIALLLLACSALGGCELWSPSVPKETSARAFGSFRPSPDSIGLDIFFVRFPHGQPQANDALWKEIDELKFDRALRDRLARNGFRAGIVAGQIPVALSELLELKDKPVPAGMATEASAADLEELPRVVRRRVTLRPQRRTDIICSNVYDELPVLTSQAQGVGGRTYYKAQGVLVTKVRPERDSRVRLELTPEICHGDPQRRFVGGPAAMTVETDRARQVFEDLKLAAVLVPGQMLVLSSLPDRPGSLGGHFFRHESQGKPEQKLMVIRVSQTQPEGLYPDEPPQPRPADALGDEDHR